MDSFVSITKVVSDEAKNISSWIEWIVLADLTITVVENDHYLKHTTLKPTKHTTSSNSSSIIVVVYCVCLLLLLMT